jgi:hypothetical protein
MEEIYFAAVRSLALLASLDTTTAMEVELSPADQESGLGGDTSHPNFHLLAPVLRLRGRFASLLARLKAAKGPEPGISLTVLVAGLSEVWLRETGQPVRANPAERGVYSGRPRSVSGRFIFAAVKALQPTAA